LLFTAGEEVEGLIVKGKPDFDRMWTACDTPSGGQITIVEVRELVKIERHAMLSFNN
jgi:hypothetical protein